ncbi:protein YELLOW LEAF 1, choloroplastic-like isoform X2 [Solanum lycopersicum]
MSLTASTIMSVTTLPIVRAGDQCQKQFKPIVLHLVGMQLQLNDNRKSLRCSVQERRASIICAAALNARCAEGQTQTVTRESSTITVAPVQGKEKSPDLDDGGTGFPPRDDDGGGGGGGGGGGHWKGGFFFFGFLAFLGLLKDQEEEGPYRDQRRR